MITRGKSLILGNLTLKTRGRVGGQTETQEGELMTGVPTLHLADLTKYYRPSMLPLPKYSWKSRMKNS